MARLDDLPAEVIQLILSHLSPSQPQLARLALVSPCLTAPAQYLLFANASITSLDQFDSLLNLLQPPRTPRRLTGADALADSDPLGWDDDIDDLTSPWARALGTTRLRVECKNFGEKGWGSRLGRLLRLAANVRAFELRGIHDLRIKFLQGRGGATSLSITSTTFKNHALTTSPDLATFMRSVRHLTLGNLGLPLPSTHAHELIRHCARNLTYLALSALRDVNTPQLLLSLFALLSPASAPNLRHLRFGSLDARQAAILALPEGLPRLTQVERLEWTFPWPDQKLLDATPTGVQALVLKARARVHVDDKEARMQAMDQEDRVYGVMVDALNGGALARSTAGGGVQEVLWGGAAGAGRRLEALAGDQIEVRLAHDW